jgi:hypothetical protein
MLNPQIPAPPWPAMPLVRADAIRLQIRRIVDHASEWLFSDELLALATALREAAGDCEAAAQRRGCSA